MIEILNQIEKNKHETNIFSAKTPNLQQKVFLKFEILGACYFFQFQKRRFSKNLFLP